MEQNEHIIEMFKQFAEKRLSNHLQELETRYENMQLDSEGVLQKAYDDHRQIYRNELNEKLQSLLPNEKNPWLEGELNNLKHGYELKLSFKH